MLAQAVRFAHLAHTGQVRKYSGCPYITHPLRVMCRAMVLHDSEAVHCAAVLHDVMEDCGVEYGSLADTFSPAVAMMVRGLTNRSKVDHPEMGRAARKRLDRERLANEPAEVKLLKLIDRIDNLEDVPRNEPFFKIYTRESLLLLEVLRGTDKDLEDELYHLASAATFF